MTRSRLLLGRRAIIGYAAMGAVSTILTACGRGGTATDTPKAAGATTAATTAAPTAASAATPARAAGASKGDPLPVRYFAWIEGATHGDFGRSFRSYTPVATMYRQRIGNTALLTLCAVTIGALVAIPLGTLAAYRRGSALDTIAQFVAVLGSAVPGFWIAFVLIEGVS